MHDVVLLGDNNDDDHGDYDDVLMMMMMLADKNMSFSCRCCRKIRVLQKGE